MQKLTADESKSFDFGPSEHHTTYRVTVTRHAGGVTIYTQVGADYNSTLSRVFTNAQLAEGGQFFRYLRDSAQAGLPVWQIEAGVSAILAAAVVVDDAEQAMVDGIAANLAATDERLGVNRKPAAPARHNGWWAERKRYIRPTATGVHTKRPTAAQMDRIRQHRNGRVTLAPGQPWTLLDGIVQRGYADEASIEYKPGTRQIKAVHLNQRGWALLGQQSGVAA